MCNPLGRSQCFFPTALIAGLGLVFLCGCTADFSTFPSGVYTGTPTCLLDVTGPTGATGQETFTENLTVAIDESNTFTINGVPVEIGAMQVRSLPNAELAFEIVAAQQSASELQITYEPRPTLPGIEISGSLVETYRWDDDRLTVSATADLEVKDVGGVSTFFVTCDGNLTPTASNP